MADKWVPATTRPNIMGLNYMVSTGHYLASLAATRILDAGGNAIDAGVAGGLCLNVVQPDLTSIGGVAPISIFSSDTGRVSTVSGLGTWPAKADPEFFHVAHGGRIPAGIHRTVVPSAIAAWLTALERFGTMSLDQVAAPAIELAEKGFPAHQIMHDTFTHEPDLANMRSWPSTASVFLNARGLPHEVGETVVQSDLARSLTRLVVASAGAASREAGIVAARDLFYRGDMARSMAEFSRTQGGWLEEGDLAGFEVELEEACMVDYRGHEVYSCGPWSQGPVVLETLNILEGFDMAAIPLDSSDYYHVVIEALKASFADRDRYYGDPRFIDVPIDGLLSKEYAAQWRARIDLGHATLGMPEPGNAWDFSTAAEAKPSAWQFPSPLAGRREPDTSYLCVVDSHGNAFSATPSDGATSTPLVPGLGFTMSSRGMQSWLDPRHPSSLEPGKRPRLTPNPGMVVKKGKFVMPYGTPGNDVQPQAMVQFLIGTLDHGLDLQAAIERPRAVTYSFPGSSDPHTYTPGLVKVESRVGTAVIQELSERGHSVQLWPEWTGVAGSICAVRADLDPRRFIGAADPRRVSYALGW